MTQNELNAAFVEESESQKTRKAVADLLQYLFHDTLTTRRQLIGVLRERMEVIRAELQTDEALADLASVRAVRREEP